MQWTEHVYAFQGTGGLDAATASAAGRAVCTDGKLQVLVCPTRAIPNASLAVAAVPTTASLPPMAEAEHSSQVPVITPLPPLAHISFATDPQHPFKWEVPILSNFLCKSDYYDNGGSSEKSTPQKPSMEVRMYDGPQEILRIIL